MKPLIKINEGEVYAINTSRYLVKIWSEGWANRSGWTSHAKVSVFTEQGWVHVLIHKKDFKSSGGGDERPLSEKETEFRTEVLQMIVMWHDGV